MTALLCRLDAIADGGSAVCFAEHEGAMTGFIVVRRGDAAFVYVNSCPHVGAPLDFTPGQFLDPSGTHILCSGHGALFRIDDGYCVSGPCAGEALTAVAARVDGGAVILG